MKPVEIDYKIYIPIVEEDLVTEENLDDTTCPLMIKEDLQVPCNFSKKKYDPSRQIKIRILSNRDWFAVNWKKKKLFDPDMEPVKIKAIVIHIHRGGFIGGSSSASRGTTYELTKELGVPYFSIDYRISPDSKFPDALND